MGRERYHGHQEAGHGPAALELRVTSADGSPRSDADYRDAVRQLGDSGVVPAGWQVTAVKWGAFRQGHLTTWRAGDPVDVASFGAVLAKTADRAIGIERTTSVRHVTRERWVERVTVELRGNERWVATGGRGKYATGQFVPAAYARRYPQLVTLQPRTRTKVQRREQVKERVTVVRESAVVRVTYKPKAFRTMYK